MIGKPLLVLGTLVSAAGVSVGGYYWYKHFVFEKNPPNVGSEPTNGGRSASGVEGSSQTTNKGAQGTETVVGSVQATTTGITGSGGNQPQTSVSEASSTGGSPGAVS